MKAETEGKGRHGLSLALKIELFQTPRGVGGGGKGYFAGVALR